MPRKKPLSTPKNGAKPTEGKPLSEGDVIALVMYRNYRYYTEQEKKMRRERAKAARGMIAVVANRPTEDFKHVPHAKLIAGAEAMVRYCLGDFEKMEKEARKEAERQGES